MEKHIKKEQIPEFVHSYKLRSNPFHLDPEQKHFFVNSTLGQRLEFLNRLVESNDFLILVIGEEGAGKTTLLNHFLSKASDKWRSCRISANPGSDSTQDFENLNGHPAFILQDESPVIMLDNAHALTVDELAFLIELAGRTGNTSKVKRIVLFSEPQIQVKLTDLSKRVADEGTINKIYIPQLSYKDTSEYISQRLKIAGFRGKNLFSPGELKEIFKKSGGLPKKINEEASKILIKKSGGNLFGKFRNIGLIAASFFLAAVLSVIFLKDNISPVPEKRVVNIEKRVKKDIPDVKKNPLKREEIVSKIPEENEIKEKIDKKPVRKSEKKAEKTIKKQVKKQKTRYGIKSEKWLLSQKPSWYTLQIIGVRKKESIYSFAKKHNLKEFAFFHTSFKNKDWYPLLYGIYPTFKEATRAIKKLPKEFRIYSPWVRQMSSVHRAIKTKKTAFAIVRAYAHSKPEKKNL